MRRRRPTRWIALVIGLVAVSRVSVAQDALKHIRIGSAPIGAQSVVHVPYATERSVRGGWDPSSYYGAERAPLQFGICEVGIPPGHKIGRLEARWGRKWNPAKDVVLGVLEIYEVETEHFAGQLRSKLAAARIKEIFLFVHGYANSFEKACRRTAQMWTDLQFKGIPIAYAWASQDNYHTYGEDQTTVQEWTIGHFREFVTMIRDRSGATDLHIVAHSMGSRVVMEALAGIAREGTPSTRVGLEEVVLFAPDIHSRRFQELAPLVRMVSKRVSVYASTKDLALGWAQHYDDFPRAGDLRSSPTGIDGIDMIDAAPVDYSLSGHTYNADNRVVIEDLMEVLAGKPASQRQKIRKSVAGHYEFLP